MFRVPDARFYASLQALANPVRAEIVSQLRTPKALREVEVFDPAHEGRDVPLARQTVRWHIEKLLEAGLVEARDGVREYGETTEFTVNHQRIFALGEDVTAFARLRSSVEFDAQTLPSQAPEMARDDPHAGRARLVLVHGLELGTTFHLQPDGRHEWVIGRRRGSDVPLDFDPSVSTENAIVRFKDGAHSIEDIPGSRNGTFVNFTRLKSGVPHGLRHGDIVGVGRCLLVYWR